MERNVRCPDRRKGWWVLFVSYLSSLSSCLSIFFKMFHKYHSKIFIFFCCESFRVFGALSIVVWLFTRLAFVIDSITFTLCRLKQHSRGNVPHVERSLHHGSGAGAIQPTSEGAEVRRRTAHSNLWCQKPLRRDGTENS